MALTAKAVILVFVVLAAGIWPTAARARDAVRDEPLKLVALDGSVWTADQLKGRVTLIDFWATWCAPCLADLPLLKQARARYTRDEFEVVGVSFDVSDRRSFISWINRQGVVWPQVFEGRGARSVAARQFQVDAVPSTFLFGADGRLVAKNLRGRQLLAAIDAQVALSQ
jgi:thiol-disulfide isomerase/thioredoxin